MWCNLCETMKGICFPEWTKLKILAIYTYEIFGGMLRHMYPYSLYIIALICSLLFFKVERYVGWDCIPNCFMLSSLPCFYAFCWSAIPTSRNIFNVFLFLHVEVIIFMVKNFGILPPVHVWFLGSVYRNVNSNLEYVALNPPGCTASGCSHLGTFVIKWPTMLTRGGCMGFYWDEGWNHT